MSAQERLATSTDYKQATTDIIAAYDPRDPAATATAEEVGGLTAADREMFYLRSPNL